MSTSSSSLTVEQKPALVTSNLTHTSCEMLRQVPPVGHCPFEKQTFATLLHVPVIGQPPAPVSAVQMMELDRLQFPEANVVFWAAWQSPSHASPSASLSVLVCVGLGTRTQLSFLSWMPSPSRSLEELQASPRVVEPWPGTWNGLYTSGQLSSWFAIPSKSTSSRSQSSPTPSPSLSIWVGLVAVGQLSHSVPKPSASPTHVPVPHTVEDEQGLPGVAPPTQAPFSWPGLYTWGQLSVPTGGAAMPSPSTFSKVLSANWPSASASHSGSL